MRGRGGWWKADLGTWGARTRTSAAPGEVGGRGGFGEEIIKSGFDMFTLDGSKISSLYILWALKICD